MNIDLISIQIISIFSLLLLLYAIYNIAINYQSEKMIKNLIVNLDISDHQDNTEKYQHLSNMQSKIHKKLTKLFPLALLIVVSYALILLAYQYDRNALKYLITLLAVAAFMLLLAKYQRKKEKKTIVKQLPNVINIFNNYFNSQMSINHIIHHLAYEAPNPIRKYFQQCDKLIQGGQSFSHACRQAAQAYNIMELDFFALLLSLHIQSNNIMKRTLNDWSRYMRKQEATQQKINSTTTESRYSFYILTMGPLVMFFLFYTRNPNYLEPIINTPQGHIAAVIAVVLYITGVFLAKMLLNLTQED